MSTNTKSGWGNAAPSGKGGGGESESSNAQHAQGDKWRKEFQEKQSDKSKRFTNVKAPPAVRDEGWWTPDPMTGVYVPDYYHGCVTTTPRESRKKASGFGGSYERNETELDHWFENMEELPDMERHKKK